MLSSDHEESMLRYAHRPAGLADRRYKPHMEVAPNCPRCGSPNTKFCYYNNYSLSQPRYFCKGCRRYWTKGGSLRNVPVGGGCRKNRRGKSTRAVDDTAATRSVTLAQRLPGPVRPDLVLEVMAGRPASPGQPMSAGVPAPADRPTIDLALLYAKLLHHQADGSSGSLTEPLAGRHVSEAEALFDTFRVSSDMSPSVQVPSSTTMACTDGRALALGELNFCMDQSCYDSLGLPKGIENSIFSPSGSTVPSVSPWKADAKYGPFDSLPDDATSLHVGICSTGDGDWSSALDSQGLDALCRP